MARRYWCPNPDCARRILRMTPPNRTARFAECIETGTSTISIGFKADVAQASAFDVCRSSLQPRFQTRLRARVLKVGGDWKRKAADPRRRRHDQ